MKTILLTKGKVVLVDDEDFTYLNQWKWYYGYGYAHRAQYLYTRDGKEYYKRYRMHRVILNTPEGLFVDHKDGNRLNNQKNNIRNCTKSDNQSNHAPHANNSSGHKNIYWHKQDRMWRVKTTKNDKMFDGGLFHNIEDAIRARDNLVQRIHGEFARTEAFNV